MLKCDDLERRIEADKQIKTYELIAQSKMSADINFDKTLLTLASSAIGLSFFLLDKYNQLTTCPAFLWLLVAWAGLVTCIISIAISMRLSVLSHDAWINAYILKINLKNEINKMDSTNEVAKDEIEKLIDDMENRKEVFEMVKDKNDKKTHLCNKITIWSFITGIIIYVFVIVMNLR